ncbi:hypothetical protein ACFL2K_03765 [Candidatus Margulisiibacteriota bacterium]
MSSTFIDLINLKKSAPTRFLSEAEGSLSNQKKGIVSSAPQINISSQTNKKNFNPLIIPSYVDPKNQNEYRLQYIDSTDELYKKIIFHIRYFSYRKDNYIGNNKEKMLYDKFDNLPNSLNCLLFINNEPVAAIRGCIYLPEKNWLEIPALKAYKKEIKNNIGLDKSFLEFNKFVFLPSAQSNKLMPKLLLYKSLIQIARYYDIDYLIGCIRPSHKRFYERLFVNQLSNYKSYPNLKFKPALYGFNFKKIDCLFSFNPKNKIFNKMSDFILG